MKYFEDLTNYSYLYHENSKNIVWLDNAYPYQKGKVSKEFIDKLWRYLHVKINLVREFNNCSLCPVEDTRDSEVTYNGESIRLGFAEIRVLGEDGNTLYAAPDHIYHYIIDHEYMPPKEFIQAVLKGPKPDSFEYEKFLSSQRKYTLHGENIKNIQIAKLGGNEDYIKVTEEFHASIIQNNLNRVIELINSCKEQVTIILDLSAWLFIAASEGKLEIVKHLLRCDSKMYISKPESNPLFGAICGGHIHVVKLLIESGIDISIKYSNQFMKNKDALAFAQEKFLSTPCYKAEVITEDIIAIQATESFFEVVPDEIKTTIKMHLGEDAFVWGNKSIWGYKDRKVPKFDLSGVSFNKVD